MAAKPIDIQAAAVTEAAQTVAASIAPAAWPGPVPAASGGSPIDAAAAGVAGAVINTVAAASADLAPRSGELRAKSQAAVAAMKAKDAENAARIRAVPTGLRDPPPSPGTDATPPGPVDMPTGSVVVCEPYTPCGGFICWEWFLDGRVRSVWSPTDRSGAWW